jgi:hypothetical protein
MPVTMRAATEFRRGDAATGPAGQPAMAPSLAAGAQRLDATVLTLDNHFHDVPNLRVLNSPDDPR